MKNILHLCRREALATILLGLTCARGWGKSTPQSPKTPALFKGFIVSDAHFGWKHPAQASNVTIAQNIGHILERFNDLDVFLDSGDIHHGNSDDQGRADWTRFLQAAVGELPLYLAAGNHEICNFSHADPEPEARTMMLGSMTCRPYYSVDMKGIHLIFLPELINANLITSETLAWLKLDLDLNKNKTTLIITHNSLQGTTRHWDSTVYRRLANTDQVQELLSSYPNVVAWMHGHNHTWELVEKHRRFYVSNGRIGGFSPPYPDDHVGWELLGGIYFEIGSSHFTVRGYSSNKRCFLDELPGYKQMSKTMNLKTSFDPSAPTAHSWGMGGARDGLSIPVYQHHLAGSAGKQELFLAPTNTPVFSENSDLAIHAEHPSGWSVMRQVTGLSVSPTEDVDGEIDGIRFLESGIELLPLGNGQDRRSLHSPARSCRAAYYKCTPGQAYQARVVARGPSQVTCTLVYQLYDNNGKLLEKHADKKQALSPAGRTIEAVYKIPNSVSDAGQANLLVEARFDHLTKPIQVMGFDVQLAEASGATRDVAVTIADQHFKVAGILPDQPRAIAIDHSLSSQDAVTVAAGGNGRVSWLVRQTHLAWQVRNAPVQTLADGSIRIGPLRNRYNDENEIIIVPLQEPSGPYAHRLRGIDVCRIEPYDPMKREFRMHVEKTIGDYQHVLMRNTPGSPSGWENVGDRSYEAYHPNAVGFVPKVGDIVVRF